jgi:tetratricopeptide (TPR) repeat protein
MNEQENEFNNVQSRIEPLTKSILENPRDWKNYYERGVLYGQIVETEKAISDFTTVIELEPENAEAHYNRGMAHTHLHEVLASIDDYSATIKLNNVHIDAYNNRAAAYLDLRQGQLALEDINSAMKIDGLRPTLHALKSLALTFLGKDLEAKDSSVKAIKLGFNSSALEYLIQKAQQERESK